MPAEAPFLFPPYSSNEIIEFSHFQEMVLPWDFFFVSNGTSKRTGLDLYADNVNNKYGCFHCRAHILYLTHPLTSLLLLRYYLHYQLLGS